MGPFNKFSADRDEKVETLTSGMNLTKLSRQVLKSFVDRPIIALQTKRKRGGEVNKEGKREAGESLR